MNLSLDLNSCQQFALERLESPDNVFLTGVAGSGKSYLIRAFLKDKDPKEYPVLASTGAAAILVGGRTFHSYFGLGIMQGGLGATVERATRNSRLVKRLKKTKCVIIDETSMLQGVCLRAAETICRTARGSEEAWGGLRVIAVGDFAQLPPVSLSGQDKDWAFKDPTWDRSCFVPAVLRTIVRTLDPQFLEVLNRVREGRVDSHVLEFLKSRTIEPLGEATRLFPHRDTTERYNLERLDRVPGQASSFATQYTGAEKSVTDLKKFAPIPEILRLKEGALVMLRQNDPLGRWVNGSLGTVTDLSPHRLQVELMNGREVAIDPASFSLQDAEGHEVASARNFPINLAYATTIHKAQGMTLDRAVVDLRNLWEAGQAYVAMSRVKTAEGLALTGWTRSSIRTDPSVTEFNSRLFS